jgi:hypothetical protein
MVISAWGKARSSKDYRAHGLTPDNLPVSVEHRGAFSCEARLK